MCHPVSASHFRGGARAAPLLQGARLQRAQSKPGTPSPVFGGSNGGLLRQAQAGSLMREIRGSSGPRAPQVGQLRAPCWQRSTSPRRRRPSQGSNCDRSRAGRAATCGILVLSSAQSRAKLRFCYPCPAPEMQQPAVLVWREGRTPRPAPGAGEGLPCDGLSCARLSLSSDYPVVAAGVSPANTTQLLWTAPRRCVSGARSMAGGSRWGPGRHGQAAQPRRAAAAQGAESERSGDGMRCGKGHSGAPRKPAPRTAQGCPPRARASGGNQSGRRS